MYSPVERLLTVLNLLQARASITAAELAERLEVNTRSIRRYITMLQDLGIPVEAERGRYGGYRLRPGFKLPPLMWTEDEAMAVALGLRAAESLGFGGAQPGVASALAKVERVLPLNIQERVRAVQDVVILYQETTLAQGIGIWVNALSSAAYREQRTWIAYRSKEGEQTERALDCYGLLYLERQWYAIGYCHLRQAVRMFRLDRILRVEPREEYFTRPRDFDLLSYALQAIRAMPSRWLVEVLLRTTLEQVRRAVPLTYAALEERRDGLLLRVYDDDLDRLARLLVSLGCPFVVIQPPELLDAMQRLAEKVAGMVAQAREDQTGT